MPAMAGSRNAQRLTAQELENKFRGLASVSASPAQVDEIVRLVANLDKQKDLSGLISQLSPARLAS